MLNLLRGLPDESEVKTLLRGGRPHWNVEAHLLDDLRIVLTGSKKHPAQRHPMRPRPQPAKHTAERARKLAIARKRAQERRRQIEAGEIT